jgi:hypothetical protein
MCKSAFNFEASATTTIATSQVVMIVCTTPSAPVIGKKKPDLEDLNADSSCVEFDWNASQRTGRSNDNKRTEMLVARRETIASSKYQLER